MEEKQWVVNGALFGFFGVLLGAFGAHGLKDSLDKRSLEIYQTAVQYQQIHALALILFGIWMTQHPLIQDRVVGNAFSAGIFLFSGSLYVLAITRLSFLGAIAPLGGLCLLAGWIRFAFLAWKT